MTREFNPPTFNPRITLEQWRVFRAVIQEGGYAQAATYLHKSQSAVTYAIQKMERVLAVELFVIQGRKAVLTPAGEVMYRRSRSLLEEASVLEATAHRLAQGQESEIRLAVDTIFPTWLLLKCLDEFAQKAPDTRIELFETVLGGTVQALQDNKVDLAIGGLVPQGLAADPLMRVRFIAVAAPFHPLHSLQAPIGLNELKHFRQLVIRDSGAARTEDAGWLDAEQRWTVSHKATSIRAVMMGLGFAWFPEHVISSELDNGELKPLLLESGAERFAELYVLLPTRTASGVGVKYLRELFQQSARRWFPQEASIQA